MNNTIDSIAATLLIVASVFVFEKFPNTYPITNTILAANRILIKMIEKNIILDLMITIQKYHQREGIQSMYRQTGHLCRQKTKSGRINRPLAAFIFIFK
jgi:hypothetical protein